MQQPPDFDGRLGEVYEGTSWFRLLLNFIPSPPHHAIHNLPCRPSRVYTTSPERWSIALSCFERISQSWILVSTCSVHLADRMLTRVLLSPHDGQNITFMQAVRCMNEVYNLSYPLGILLTMGGMLLCGKWWQLPWRFNLHELARHNRIEHDASLTHADAGPDSPFAPVHPDHMLLNRLLHITERDSFTIDDFAKARIQRAIDDQRPLDTLHRLIAHGESSLTMCIFGMTPEKTQDATSVYEKVVPRSFISQWFGEDRLPIGWRKPEEPVGFFETNRVSNLLAKQIWLRDWIARSA